MRRNLVIKYYCHRPADDINAGGGAGDTGSDTPKEDRGDDFTPPSDTPPADTPPSDTPPADTPPADTPPADTQESHSIPKPRFDEVNNKLRDSQAELERLRAEVAALKKPADPPKEDTPPVDPAAQLEDQFTARAAELQEQINQALFDGDGDKAKQLQTQLVKETAAFSRQIAKLEAGQLASSTYEERSQAEQARQLAEAAVKVVTGKFSQFDASSEKYDAEATNEMADLADFYASKGMSLDQAITKAADTIAAGKGFQAATAAAAAAEATAAAAASRTASARSAVMDAVKGAAPVAPVGGPTSGTITPAMAAAMSDKDFAKLSDEDKAKARGDDFVPTA